MIRGVFRAFRNAIFPVKCMACGGFFHEPKDPTPALDPAHPLPTAEVFARIMAPFLCPACRKTFAPIRPPICTRCGRMFATESGNDHECGACIQDPGPCLRIRSAGLYEGALKSAIHALKYGHKRQLAKPLGMVLHAAYRQYYDGEGIDCIIPIPLHGSRMRERGFNQAALILESWPGLLHVSGNGRMPEMDGENLVRNRKTPTQTGLGREKRRKNVKQAFSVTRPDRIRAKEILLVDDVLTTGSTVRECAKTLMAAGAKSVRVLTLARVD